MPKINKAQLNDLISKLQITMLTGVCKHPVEIRQPDLDFLWYCPICGANSSTNGWPEVVN